MPGFYFQQPSADYQFITFLGKKLIDKNQSDIKQFYTSMAIPMCVLLSAVQYTLAYAADGRAQGQISKVGGHWGDCFLRSQKNDLNLIEMLDFSTAWLLSHMLKIEINTCAKPE